MLRFDDTVTLTLIAMVVITVIGSIASYIHKVQHTAEGAHREIAKLREEIAKDYAGKELIREMEARLSVAIERIATVSSDAIRELARTSTEAINHLGNRIDRIFHQDRS